MSATESNHSPISIHIPATFGGEDVVGVFEAFVNVREQDTVRTNYLLDGVGDQILSVLVGLVDDDASEAGGIHLDFGSKQRAITIDADVTGGEKRDRDGNTLQWGSTDDPDILSRTSATGGTARQKKDVFQYYVSAAGGGTDSTAPAVLEYGEFSEDGLFDPLNLVLEDPKFEKPRDSGGSKYRVNLTMAETIDLSENVGDGSTQTEG